jgi:hypothetical protein
MFPDYDRDVLSSVLAMSGGVDDAIQQLLEMGGGGGGAPGVQHQSDEELALALFKQFADDLERQLGRPIPADVRRDPVRYEAFVREHFERELAREGSQLSSQALQVSCATQPLPDGGIAHTLDRVHPSHPSRDPENCTGHVLRRAHLAQERSRAAVAAPG